MKLYLRLLPFLYLLLITAAAALLLFALTGLSVAGMGFGVPELIIGWVFVALIGLALPHPPASVR